MSTVVRQGEGAPATGDEEMLTPSAALSRFVPNAEPEADSGAAQRAGIRYGFSVSGLGLLIGERASAEVVAVTAVAEVPSGPRWLLGVMNLRGGVVPLLDIRRALDIDGQETAAAGRPMAVVFGKGEHAIGVMVDEPPQALKELAAMGQLPPLPERLTPHVTAGYEQDQRCWLEFQHEGFFDSLVSGPDADGGESGGLN